MKRAIVLLALMIGTAHAQSAEDAHVQAANDYYKVGNFEGALAEYKAAYALDPKPDYLYAMATIEDQRGGCAAAIELYQQFLDTHPPDEDVAAAKSAIDVCKAKLGVVEPPPRPAPPRPVEKRAPPPPETRRVQRSMFHDLLGDTLTGAGVATGAAAGIVYYFARATASDASDPRTQDDYDRQVALAKSLRSVSEIAAGAGAVLVVAGVVRWMTVDRWETVPVAPMTANGAVGLTYASRW